MLQICFERSPKVLVSNIMPQHMEHTTTLLICMSVKEIVRMLVYFCYNWSDISSSSFFKIIICNLHHVVLKFIVASTGLPVKRFTIGSKSFVEPDMLPVSASYEITKPLMS